MARFLFLDAMVWKVASPIKPLGPKTNPHDYKK
jgi:hypothetical protein